MQKLTKIEKNRELVQEKTRFWTILGYFLLTRDIKRKIYEDNENQVHFDVRSIATMLYSNLETGSKDKINLLGKRIGFSELRKMSSVSIIISVNYDIQLPEKSYLEVALGCYSIWSSTGHTWFFNKIQNKPS
jgi:hypothetical protein